MNNLLAESGSTEASLNNRPRQGEIDSTDGEVPGRAPWRPSPRRRQAVANVPGMATTAATAPTAP